MKKPNVCLMGALLGLALLSGCGLAGCGIVFRSNTIKGSGVPATTNYALTGFTGIAAQSAFHVNVQQGPIFSVKVTIDDNLLEHLDVRLSGDRLHLGLKPVSLSSSQIRAEVTMPELAELEGRGASHILITGFDSDKAVTIKLRNASHLQGDIKCGSGEFSISGASRLELQGKTGNLRLEAANASQAELGDYPVKEAVVQASGASHILLNASEFLDASAKDASSIRYLGTPGTLKTHSSGASSVKPK